MPGRAIKGTQFRSFVLYGRSGTGKTTLASTFPKPALLLDIRDEGTDSVADVAGLDCRELESFEDFEDMYWWLKKNPKYKTVIIDTVSQLQNMLMKELVGNKGRKGKSTGDWGSMTKRDWGDVAAELKEWLINYRDLSQDGINVVFIAQDRIFNLDEESGTAAGEIDPEVGPQLMPSVAKTLNASVSVIGNTFVRMKPKVKEVKGKKIKSQEEEYCLRIGPSPVYITKVRKPKSIKAPAFILDPTYEDIIDIIKGE